MNKLVNTREALAVAIYAFDANDQLVYKDMYYPDQVDHYPNKAYLLKHFVDPAAWLGIPPITITEELLDRADKAKQQLEYMITMAALTKGKINSFVESCATLMAGDQISTKNFSTLVWIPKIIKSNEEEETARMRSAVLEHSSKYIGKVGDQVEIQFNLIEKRFIGKIDCWAVYGHTNEGNLVKFLTKHQSLADSGNIKGRVKEVDRDSYRNNAQVTSLNHVKRI